MIKRKVQLERIQAALSHLESAVAMGNKQGWTDLNVHSEEFIRGLLNLVYGWRLIGANGEVANFPCIDLIDTTRGIGVQVTSEKGAAKINSCLECCESRLSATVSKLYVFSLIKKQRTYKLSVVANVAFDEGQIIGFADILRLLKSMDSEQFQKVYAFITDSFAHLSSDSSIRSDALSKSIVECLQLLDREVLSAPFRFEEPTRMYEAIREIRRSLRTKGAGRVFDVVAAAEFNKIIDELVACEAMIRDEYPYISDPVPDGPNFEVIDHHEYWNVSVRKMMAIRDPINASISIIEARLAALSG